MGLCGWILRSIDVSITRSSPNQPEKLIVGSASIVDLQRLIKILSPLGIDTHPHADALGRDRKDAIATVVNNDSPNAPIEYVCPLLSAMVHANIHALVSCHTIADDARKTIRVIDVSVADEAFGLSEKDRTTGWVN